MADKIPQYDNSQPVFTPQGVNSRAAGFEDFAKAFGQAAGAAEEQFGHIEDDASKTMYMHSVANIEQIKKDADLDILQHPERASKAAETMKQTTDDIVKNTRVNKSDRLSLDYYGQQSTSQVAYKAAETNVRQTKLMAAYTSDLNWPDQYTAYTKAMINDPAGKTADKLQQAMIANVKGLVASGILSPSAGASRVNQLKIAQDSAQDHIEMYKNANTTAKDYQTVTSSPLNQGTSNAGTPIEGNTRWMTDFYNNDHSFQGVLADIANRNLPNPTAFDNLQSAQRKRAIMAVQGVQIADGYVNSGQPFPVIEHQYNALNQRGEVLSYRDQATKQALGSYVNGLKSGNYLEVIGKTPEGGAIMQDYVNRNSAIQQSGAPDDQKVQLMIQNKNNLVNSAVAYGQATHTPSQYIQPIPSQDVGVLKNGFKANQDPAQVLSVVSQYNKTNVSYLANALPKANQRMAVAAVAYSTNVIPPQDKLDFIAANQEGRSYSELQPQPKVSSYMEARVINNLKDQTSLISQQYEPQNADTLKRAMINNTLNYAKFLAVKNNDFTLDNYKDYVDQASKIYSNSFQKVSSSNYAVNPNQLPMPLTKTDLDILADYATYEGQTYLKNGRKDYEYNSAISRNPLTMIFSPTNEVMAVDGNGKPYFSMPFTSSLLAHANDVVKKRRAADFQTNLDAFNNRFGGGR